MDKLLAKDYIKVGVFVGAIVVLQGVISALQKGATEYPDIMQNAMISVIEILWPAIVAGDKLLFSCSRREAIYRKYHEVRLSATLKRALLTLCEHVNQKANNSQRAYLVNAIFEEILLRREKIHKHDNTPVMKMDIIGENVLRYACGYIPMALRRQARKR
ncbi:uncharacterized protein LOC102801827, partial [Saccoglossus kowalevskii]|uniref:Uncharacterized protein LOC102801827 n=1 Tax=Saccoglossus kowalevskii TaxID=10224 RepID=A0ABM0MBA6_SACKO